MSLQEQFESADKLLEEYQRKLKHSQKLKNITNLSNSMKNTTSIETTVENSDKIEDSIGSLESQLIDQFRQYKNISKKLEEAKKELYLSTQIEVSVKAYKDLDRAYKEKNKNLENEFFERKKLLEQDLELLTEKKEIIKKKNDESFSKLEIGRVQQIYLNSISVETDLCIKHELLEYNYLDLKFEFSNKTKDLTEKYNEEFFLNQEKIEKIKNTVSNELDLFKRKKEDLKHSIDLEKDFLLSQVNEEMKCISFEHNFIQHLFSNKNYELEKQIKYNHKNLTRQLLDFNDQLEQKKQIWDKEKVVFFEEIAAEKLLWSQEKDEMLLEINVKTKQLETDVENFEKEKIEREKIWKDKQKSYLNDIENKKTELESKINMISNDIDLLDKKKIKKLENIEFLNMVLFEKDSYFDFKLKIIDSEIDTKRKILLVNLENEIKQLKEMNVSEINKINDKQGIDLSLRLSSFEEDLANRKKVFEDELVQKRQQIILESKREQKLEFNHILEFEKNKFIKEIDGLNDQIKDKQIEIKNLERNLFDQKNNFQMNIEEIISEKENLSKELVEVENLTRKSVMVNYEEKYKNLLDSYKSQSSKQIQQLKSKISTYEINFKNKDQKIRDLQLSVKRLESELNRQIIKDSTSEDETFTFTRVIRSKNRD